MTRTLGFFLGSAAVFAMLIYFLGQPVPLAAPKDRDRVGAFVSGDADQPKPAAHRVAVVESAMATETEIVATAAAPPVIAEPAAQYDATAAAPQVEAEPAAQYDVNVVNEHALVEQWLSETVDIRTEHGPPAPADATLQEPTAAATADAGAGAPEWFMVWDPFHSELSANAFARRLERITGLDYRVINTDPGLYRVAVGYKSEAQRVANVAAIEQATGLSINGGSR